MSYYSCQYCFTKYKLKKNLNSHVALCKEYHRIQTEDPSNESLPQPKMLYRMLKDLIINQQKLENEVLLLKNKLNIQQKKDVILWLNETTNKQMTIHENIKMGFSKWGSLFTIQQSHLNSVFEGGITDGIQSVLLDKIKIGNEGESRETSLPIRAFSQKPNHLYIYDIVKQTKKNNSKILSEQPVINSFSGGAAETKDEFIETKLTDLAEAQPKPNLNFSERSVEKCREIGTYPSVLRTSEDVPNWFSSDKSKGGSVNMTAWSWRLAINEDIEIIIENIRRKLLLEFTKWQNENRHIIDSSDEMKEREINYMLIFNCINISLEKRLEIIKKWLYNTIKENHVISSVEFT
jgi:hypothetical protein